MTVPPTMLALIHQVGGLQVQGVLADTQECEGSKYHTPSPLVLRPYTLSSFKKIEMVPTDDDDEKAIWLCGTCVANLNIFLSLMEATEGNMPWEVRREFGNLIRLLGLDLWEKRTGDA